MLTLDSPSLINLSVPESILLRVVETAPHRKVGDGVLYEKVRLRLYYHDDRQAKFINSILT
jgi:hypothetical protein